MKYLAFFILFCMQSFIFENKETFDEMAMRMAKKFDAPYLKIKDLSKDVVFVDTREVNEFNVSHIKNAIHVGYKKANLNKLKAHKNKTLIIYCSVGYRSGDITARLRKQGFDAYNLYGGIFNWVNKDMTIYQRGHLVDKIHGFNPDWGKWLIKGQVVYGAK